MNTQEFKLKLRALMGADDSLRPFVCDGNPLKSEIFIVGINPATKMDCSFWDYYQDDYFDKSSWLKSYLNERKGKRTKYSPTRSKIEFLINNVFSEYLCLETNIYSKPSYSVNQLDEGSRKTDIFDFLFTTIRPKALFIHGSDPAEFIKRELGVRFGLNKPIVAKYETMNRISPLEIEWRFGKVYVCATKHLRLIKQDEISAAASSLIDMMRR
ncbi:MAG: hypothetical protein ACOX0M_07325 [Salinivirgaceae bacterium]|jgi:hypothetical protein|nr:hypothetical protein [Bacteroidales bacterium]